MPGARLALGLISSAPLGENSTCWPVEDTGVRSTRSKRLSASTSKSVVNRPAMVCVVVTAAPRLAGTPLPSMLSALRATSTLKPSALV